MPVVFLNPKYNFWNDLKIYCLLSWHHKKDQSRQDQSILKRRNRHCNNPDMENVKNFTRSGFYIFKSYPKLLELRKFTIGLCPTSGKSPSPLNCWKYQQQSGDLPAILWGGGAQRAWIPGLRNHPNDLKVTPPGCKIKILIF